jgi:predicted transcriptional regulator of viral defense system
MSQRILQRFFAEHPVFTTAAVSQFLAKNGSENRWTRKALLAHHQKQGRILRVRQGLYAVVPFGAEPAKFEPDAFLVAACATEDGVLAYHTALELYGRAHTVFAQFHFLTRHFCRPFEFRGKRFLGLPPPKSVGGSGQPTGGVRQVDRAGLTIRVTSLERTLVDVLDRPDLGGGWEEIWSSLETIEYFDLEEVITYTRLLANATTAAKVGFFLEQNRDRLSVSDAHLEPLRQLRPKNPTYLERGGKGHGSLIKAWNLIVPDAVQSRAWQEVA